MKILFVVNEPWFFLSHRLPIAHAMLKAGYEVHVATGDGAAVSDIKKEGFIHHVLPVSRNGKNPFKELKVLWTMYQVLKQVYPDILHLVTIKPVLYGGIVARLTGIRAVVSAVSGLGFTFVVPGFKGKLIRFFVIGLYRIALGMKNSRVIFQNPDDRDVLVECGAVTQEKTVIIRGSGVDLSVYKVSPEPDEIPVVTLASRLLRDKGICEFVEAARRLTNHGIKAKFWLAGELDPGYSASITSKELNSWRKEGIVELMGFRSDIADIFAASNLVVLPSYYREGLPKVLMEAAACGRAVITTDHPGCRYAIKAGETGLLVPVRDAQALTLAIKKLLEDKFLRQRMGKAGRSFAEREFDIEKIVDAHMKIYELLNPARIDSPIPINS